MKKSLMLGAMALTAAATVSSAASAKSYEFGFYSSSGGAYCDGLQFSVTGTLAVGYHIYDQTYCVFPNEAAGGYESKIPALGAGKWFTLTTSIGSGDGDPSSYVFVFYANVKALTWSLYFENTTYGVPYEFLNQGILEKGAPFAHVSPGHHKLGSTIKTGLAHLAHVTK